MKDKEKIEENIKLLGREIITVEVAIYSRNNSYGEQEEISCFKWSCFKYGEEGHKAFECSNFSKNIRGSSRNIFSCEEVVELPNEFEHGQNLMIRSVLWMRIPMNNPFWDEVFSKLIVRLEENFA